MGQRHKVLQADLKATFYDPVTPTTSEHGPSPTNRAVCQSTGAGRQDIYYLSGSATVRNGYRIYDSDTHVIPSAEVPERHAEPSFSPRLDELAKYRVPNLAGPARDPDLHTY